MHPLGCAAPTIRRLHRQLPSATHLPAAPPASFQTSFLACSLSCSRCQPRDPYRAAQPLEKGPAGVLHRPPAGTGLQGLRCPLLIAAPGAHLVEARSGAPRGPAVTAPVPAAEASRGAPPCPPRPQDAPRGPDQVSAAGVARRPAARARPPPPDGVALPHSPPRTRAGRFLPAPLVAHGCAGQPGCPGQRRAEG